MKRVEFIYFEAGGGHRSAATALKAVAEQQGRPWSIRLFNMQRELESLDIFKKISRIRFEDIYNRMLAKGWTFGSEYLLPPMHGIIRLFHSGQVKMLTDIWQRDKPDIVVSVVPNFNRALFQSVQNADPTIPFVTILTDFADYPPHFWLERQDHYVICGTERAYQQAIGLRETAGEDISGVGYDPETGFLQGPVSDRAAERARLGLDPYKPTALVLFGGEGSSEMLTIVRELQSSNRHLQMIVICGRNHKLEKSMNAMPRRLPAHIVGFTQLRSRTT